MNKRRIHFIWIALGLSLPLALHPQRRFEDVAEALVVEVPVQVLDKAGNPVRGLTAENFEVLDERKRQSLTGFSVVDLTLPAEESGLESTPLSGRRHFLFLFDLSFSRPANITRARRAALEVLDRLHPSDLTAVATFSLARGPELHLGFTGDRRQAEVAIETLGLPNLIEKHTDPLALMIINPFEAAAVDVSEVGDTAGAIDADVMFLEHVRDLSIGMRRENRTFSQGQIEKMVRDFHSLARVLDSARGRKHVVLFSEGVDTSVLLGTANQQRSGAMNESSMSGRYWEIDSEERFGSTASLSFFQSMTEEFRRVDAAVQAVDISSLDGDLDPAARGTEESLFVMADETGGELYRNFTDLAGAMREMLSRTGYTYLLAFQPQDLDPDGSYHRLRVRLKNGPNEAQVIHRPGYYAPKPFNERAPIERQLDAAGRILGSGPAGSVKASILATAFPMQGELAYVPVFAELDGQDLLASGDSRRMALEVYVYGIDQHGQVSDFFTQNIELDRKQVAEDMNQAGLRVFGALALPSGAHVIRTLVRNAETGIYGLQVVDVDVPTFDDGTVNCSPPLFPDIQTQWLLAREEKDRYEMEYPFTARGNPYIPFARPQLAGNAPVGLICFGLEGDALEIKAKVTTLDDRPVDGPSLRVIEATVGDDPQIKRILGEFVAGGLAPGEYRLKIEVSATEGEQSAAGEIQFAMSG